MKVISSKNFSEALVSFRALSDPIRLNVISLLRNKEMCVHDICETLAIKQPKLSFHLKSLRESGLLNTRQDGRWVYYSINYERFELLVEYLNQYINYEEIAAETYVR